MAFSPRGFSCLSKINVLFVRLKTRAYSRSLHRNPLKILTSEEAKKSNSKPSLVYYDSIPDPPGAVPNRKEQQTVQKNIHPMVGHNNSRKSPKNSQTEDTASKFKNPQSAMKSSHSSYAKKNNVISSPREVQKSVKMTVMACGEKCELDVVTEKSVAERKLRCVNC